MHKLDRYDIAILDVLQTDGRISRRALADKIGLSLTPCNTRFKRLENKNLIKSYNTNVNLKKIVEWTCHGLVPLPVLI